MVAVPNEVEEHQKHCDLFHAVNTLPKALSERFQRMHKTYFERFVPAVVQGIDTIIKPLAATETSVWLKLTKLNVVFVIE